MLGIKENNLIITQLQKQLKFALKIIFGISALVGLTSLVDIISDIKHHAPWHHIWVESIIFSSALFALFLLGLIFRKISKFTIKEIRSELDSAKDNANHWQKENEHLIKSLAIKIKDQFIAWALTKAECEIAFLLLKGFSLKEIAFLRKTSERTVREQAIHIYSKSGLKNRAELTAFFLEDLLGTIDS